MSRPRRFLVLLLILLITAGILWWLARLYLSSQHITALVASRLQAAFGAPIQLREADAGVRGILLRDLQVFEADASAGEDPWVVIENTRVDMPLWDLFKAAALPSQLTFTG